MTISSASFDNSFFRSSVPGSPGSLGSGAMDESDSDASDDEAPKAKLASLTGLEREQQLAELAEQENERRRIAQLKGLLSERDRRAEATKSGKRKASSADLDEDEDDSRASTRRRAKRDEAVQNLRGRLAKRRDAKKSSHSRKSSVSIDADGESDYEAPAKVDPLGELSEYQRVRVGRTNFAEVCFYPGFENFLLGCFTRVCFSLDSVTGENQYRMTQIKGTALVYFSQSIPLM
jgi:RNA polymerase-associated protein RTF1